MTPVELVAWRTRMKMSQADLARALGVNTQTVARWEQGKTERGIPPYLHLALIGLTFARPERTEKE